MAAIRYKGEGGRTGHIFVDGVELPGLRSIKFTQSIEELPLCSLELVALDGMEFEAKSDVIVTVHLEEGCCLEQFIGREGQRVWKVVRE